MIIVTHPAVSGIEGNGTKRDAARVDFLRQWIWATGKDVRYFYDKGLDKDLTYSLTD